VLLERATCPFYVSPSQCGTKGILGELEEIGKELGQLLLEHPLAGSVDDAAITAAWMQI